MYGGTDTEAIRQHQNLLIAEDHRALETDLFARIISGERMAAFDLERVDRNGQRLHVSLSTWPILDADGLITGIASSSRDAGERDKSAARSQQMLDAAVDALVGVDHDGTITLANAEAEQSFGYAAAALVAAPVDALAH